jgi:hypothetical protein
MPDVPELLEQSDGLVERGSDDAKRLALAHHLPTMAWHCPSQIVRCWLRALHIVCCTLRRTLPPCTSHVATMQPHVAHLIERRKLTLQHRLIQRVHQLFLLLKWAWTKWEWPEWEETKRDCVARAPTPLAPAACACSHNKIPSCMLLRAILPGMVRQGVHSALRRTLYFARVSCITFFHSLAAAADSARTT